MTKVQEMQAKLKSLRDEAQKLLDAGNVAEAKAKIAEGNDLKDMIKMQEELDAENMAQLQHKKAQKPAENNSVKDFANSARGLFKNSMNEGTGADGGYTVPQDIQTRINEYKHSAINLEDYIDREIVSTNSGSRVYMKRQTMTGLSVVTEGSAIGAANTPQFELLNYSLKKHTDIIPVTDELLEDSDANIAAFLTKYSGELSRIGSNKEILTVLKSVKAAGDDLVDLDGIKGAINKKLGAAYKNSAHIVTNDDGLQYLDTLKDTNGRYLLTPNPADPAKLQLACGAVAVPVLVVPNAELATGASNKVPFIIADLYEAVKKFDKGSLTMTSTKDGTAGSLSAFECDLTFFKPCERYDVKLKDNQAVVHGYITVT